MKISIFASNSHVTCILSRPCAIRRLGLVCARPFQLCIGIFLWRVHMFHRALGWRASFVGFCSNETLQFRQLRHRSFASMSRQILMLDARFLQRTKWRSTGAKDQLRAHSLLLEDSLSSNLIPWTFRWFSKSESVHQASKLAAKHVNFHRPELFVQRKALFLYFGVCRRYYCQSWIKQFHNCYVFTREKFCLILRWIRLDYFYKISYLYKRALYRQILHTSSAEPRVSAPPVA